jgi:Modulator of levamisole receptor-1
MLNALLLSLVVCVSSASPAWDARDFPNPQTDPSTCGRDVKGWVCSPDGVVSSESLAVTEGNIRAIYAGTNPYKKLFCKSSQTEVPAEVFVAVVNRVGGSGPPEKRAESFARALHDRFGVGSCGSGVVLLLAVEDRQVRLRDATPA